MRLLRPTPPEPASAPPDAPTAAIGLEGFGSEHGESPSAAASTPSAGRGSWLTVALAILVILQAVPTGLWARDYFAAAALPLAATPPADPAGASLPAAAPCEMVPTQGADAALLAPALPVAAPAAAAAPVGPQPIAAGLLSIVAPMPLQVYSRGRLVGVSEAESLMLPLGTYDLDLVNDAVGFRERRSVTLQAGRNATLRIEPPPGTLHVNAVPWAEVWMDNERLGETPIGNLRAPAGSHDLVFRHPELGERRVRVLVTLKEAARVSVDMRKP